MDDKYLKFMLTIIAIGIVGININLWKVSLFDEAYAATNQIEVTVVSNRYNPIYVKEVK
jgi:hypothetical protein